MTVVATGDRSGNVGIASQPEIVDAESVPDTLPAGSWIWQRWCEWTASGRSEPVCYLVDRMFVAQKRHQRDPGFL